MIRSAGDTGRLYGSVTSRDIARLLGQLAGVELRSEQVLLGQPIKEIGAWDVKVALHPDVIADVKVYVAQTEDEIEALVAGKSIRKDDKAGAADAEDAVVKDADNAAPAAEGKEEPETSEAAASEAAPKPRAKRAARAEKSEEKKSEEKPEEK